MATQLTPENSKYFQHRLKNIQRILKIVYQLQQSIIDGQSWNQLHPEAEPLDLTGLQMGWSEANRILLSEVQGQGCQASFDRLIEILQT